MEELKQVQVVSVGSMLLAMVMLNGMRFDVIQTAYFFRC